MPGHITMGNKYNAFHYVLHPSLMSNCTASRHR